METLLMLDDFGDNIMPDQLKDAQFLIDLNQGFCGDMFDFVNLWAGLHKLITDQPKPENEVQALAWVKAHQANIDPLVIEVFIEKSRIRYKELFPDHPIDQAYSNSLLPD